VNGVSRELKEAEGWLYSTQLFGVKLGLEGVRRLAEACSVPMGGGWGPGFIHVAGTNGKGSTCAMLEAMCRQAGLRTGLYTSPHLVSLRERFQRNGQWISEAELLDALTRMRVLVACWEPHPTFFEIATVLALEWFGKKGAEVVILETGLGGRLDATNIVTPLACVITPLGLDHQQHLGQTLAEIAWEKAGIFKTGVPVVSAPQEKQALAVLERRAAELGCPFEVVKAPWSGGKVALRGEVQRWNAALADAVLTAARIPVDASARVKGLAEVRWPGRFQEIGLDLVLDGAHNPAAAAVLVETWQEAFGAAPACLVFGSLQDKDTVSVLRALAPIAGEVVVVPILNPRALDVDRLESLVLENLPGVPCRRAASVAAALEGPASARRLVTGSLFLVGEVLACLKGETVRTTTQ